MNTRTQGFISRLKQISKKADRIDPGTAGLLGGLTGGIGSGLYAGAKGDQGNKLESGLRVGGRSLLEGTVGSAAGSMGGGTLAGLIAAALVTNKAHIPAAQASKAIGHAGIGGSILGSGVGAMAGGAHGAHASAKNINRETGKKEPMKKKSNELKLANIGATIGGMLGKAKPLAAQAGKVGGDLLAKLHAAIAAHPQLSTGIAGGAGVGAGALGTKMLQKKEPSLADRLQGFLD